MRECRWNIEKTPEPESRWHILWFKPYSLCNRKKGAAEAMRHFCAQRAIAQAQAVTAERTNARSNSEILQERLLRKPQFGQILPEKDGEIGCLAFSTPILPYKYVCRGRICP
jgi:hypothetical protein